MKYLKNYKNFKSLDICPLCLERYLTNNRINEGSGNISSLQINVPLKGCVNNCKSCIAKIHNTHLKINSIGKQILNDDKYLSSLEKVSSYCNSAILTSDSGEPLQNIEFIKKFGELNKRLNHPFDIEIQTTGVLLTDQNLRILKDINLKVICLSVFDILDYQNNLDIIDVKEKLKFNLPEICQRIKNMGFTLRISLNLIKNYDNYSMDQVFNQIRKLKADQLTFKSLWNNDSDDPINQWIRSNKASDNILQRISEYLEENGQKISNNKFILNGVSIFLVGNCMVGNYLIIRNDGELYDSWENTEPIKL